MKKNEFKRYITLLDQWARTVWPLLVTFLGGLYFEESVVNSIASTPHPALVYTIFGAFAAAAILVMVALYKFLREETFLLEFEHLGARKQQEAVQQLRWSSDLAPLYRLMSVNLSPEMKHAALDGELYASEVRMGSHLVLPGYIGGALVGLGLVGTFIGLLGTLDDLSKLFAGMANMGGADTNPVDLFSDMISRLQAPMKAMGTAFVASLYGLLGSLIVGLMAYSAKKTAMHVMDEARELVADVLMDKPSMLIAKDGHNAQAVAAQWESLFHTLRNERNLLSDELTSMKDLSRAQMALTEKGQLESTVLSNRQTGVLLQLKELATSQQVLFKEQYVFLSEQAQLQRDAMSTQHALMSTMVNRLEHLTVELSSLNGSVSKLMTDQAKAQQTKNALIEAVEKTAETVSGALRALR